MAQDALLLDLIHSRITRVEASLSLRRCVVDSATGAAARTPRTELRRTTPERPAKPAQPRPHQPPRRPAAAPALAPRVVKVAISGPSARPPRAARAGTSRAHINSALGIRALEFLQENGPVSLTELAQALAADRQAVALAAVSLKAAGQVVITQPGVIAPVVRRDEGLEEATDAARQRDLARALRARDALLDLIDRHPEGVAIQTLCARLQIDLAVCDYALQGPLTSGRVERDGALIRPKAIN